MDAFIAETAAAFRTTPYAMRTLMSATLWLMQLDAPEPFARLHQVDPRLRLLVDQAPQILATTRDPHTRRTDHALLRLHALVGLSLGQAGRFTQNLLDFLSSRIGLGAVADIIDRSPALRILLHVQTGPDSTPPRSTPPRPAQAYASALASVG